MVKIYSIKPQIALKNVYTNSEEFLQDKDNIKMFSLYDELMAQRDKISDNISRNNAKPNSEIQIQGINGFARIKKFLDKNPKMNFWDEVSIGDRPNCDYKHLKAKIRNTAITIRKNIKK